MFLSIFKDVKSVSFYLYYFVQLLKILTATKIPGKDYKHQKTDIWTGRVVFQHYANTKTRIIFRMLKKARKARKWLK